MSRACTVVGCAETHIARGYCQNHYRMFKKHGTPTPPPKPQTEAKTYIATGGYRFKSIDRKTVYEHVSIAERALGRKLPAGSEIHHATDDVADHSQLVICPNHKYHMLLHMRKRALDACGNPGWRLCKLCHQYDDLSKLRVSGKVLYHASCAARSSREYRAKRRNNGRADGR